MKKLLIDRLNEYAASDAYPLHMPGHKRQMAFPNPFVVDITEIDGFDNMHHPDGILKESMEWAAEIYGADKSYYLVNGSSGGILSAISAVTEPGGRILVSRNCHKAVFHGIFLNQLKAAYGYPQVIDEYGVIGGLLPSDIEQLLITTPDIQAVLVVSPTYDGVVSDIRGIAEVVHRFGIPLIVDEAHGAHFPFDQGPEPALALGADIVIQSVHKTLPSLTQTAILHVRSGLVNVRKLERFLQIYQSSSPSYVLMSSIESAIAFMQREGMARLSKLHARIDEMHRDLRAMKVLKLIGPELEGRYGVHAFDRTKLVIWIPPCMRRIGKRRWEDVKAGRHPVGQHLEKQHLAEQRPATFDWLEAESVPLVDGVVLADILRDEYGLEMEMSAVNYVVGITTCMDTQEGLERLKYALTEIDRGLELYPRVQYPGVQSGDTPKPEQPFLRPQIQTTIAEAWNSETEAVSWDRCEGRVSAEFIYVYPPGIPILAPGEVMTTPLKKQIEHFRQAGLTVHGGGDILECVKNR